MSELIQYRVEPGQLEKLADHTDHAGLREKLEDLRILYDGFFQYLEERFITSEQLLSALCHVIDRSELVKDSVIVLDGFTGFTPLQNSLLHHLMCLAKKVMAAVTMDRDSAGRGRLPEQELFALSAKTAENLQRIAREERIPVEPAVWLEAKEKSRLKNAPALSHLEKNLFRPRGKAYTKEDAAGQIRLTEAKNPAAELAFVAREIRRLVREEGYRYGQIAVVCGDIPKYGSYLERIFPRYEIPYFLDNTAPLLMNPMIEMIRALLQMVAQRFSYESVFRYFRCGLAKVPAETVDRLENYVLAFGIRGLSIWRQVWVRTCDGMTPEELALINEVRGRFVEEIAAFAEVCEKKDTTVREKTIALYEFLAGKGLQRQLEQKRAAFEAEGQPARAKEYGQVYQVIMNLLDQYVDLLGEEPMGIREYTEILEAGLSAPRIGLLPPGTDYVVAGDIERTRLTDISVLFFVGLNDGIVPKAQNAGSVLSELEREDLKKADIELAPDSRDSFFIQRFYLYLLLTKASEKLYLCCSSGTAAGEELKPSYLIQTICRLFPNLKVERLSERTPVFSLETKGELLSYLRETLREGETDSLWQQLFWRTRTDGDFRKDIRRMQEAHGFSGETEGIGKNLAKALYDGLSHVSVTRLETFSGCPYAHFLRYGLRLQERQLHQFTPVDNGNLFHEALERYANKLSAQGLSMADELGERQGELADQCLEESLATMGGERLVSSARGRYHVKRMKRLLRRTVWALGVQLRRGQFATANFELDFSGAGGIYPISLFQGEQTMELSGRIDRMDVLDEGSCRYLRIIDYKSGRQEFSLLKFYHGLQLQLVVYLQAAMALETRKHPEKQIIPAGIFYYRLEDPLLDQDPAYFQESDGHEEPDALLRERMLKKLRLDGYVNGDGQIIQKMDGSGAKTSSVIPVSFRQDGSLAKTGTKAATTEQMRLMMDYSDSVLKKLGERILSGETAVSPYRLEQETNCRYCSYGGVCGFDRKLSCYDYRSLQKLDAEKIWERMEGSVCRNNGQTDSGR